MSAAQVQFLTLEGEPCPPGQQPQRFSFRCVNRNKGKNPRLHPTQCGELLIANSGHGIKRDGQNQNGGRAQWDWDGNRDAPTFNPSINCSAHCGWHGYIVAGRCMNAERTQDEPE